MTPDDLRYGKLTRAMCQDQRITDTDRTVYAYIKTYVNWRVVPTQVAKELGKSLSTIKRSINRLDAAGYMAYDIKETEQKRERRNMKMLDQPSTWVKNEPLYGSELNHTQVKNEPYDEQQVGQICTIGGSKMNHVWVKNEPPGGSNLNHNVASTVASLTAASLVAATDPTQPSPLAQLANEDSAEGAEAHAGLWAKALSGIKVTGEASKPVSHDGARVVNGLLISRLGTVLGKAPDAQTELEKKIAYMKECGMDIEE